MINFAPQNKNARPITSRKDAGVAERGGLENRYTGNCIQGSNPCLSANQLDCQVFAKSTPNITPKNGSNIGCFVVVK